MGKDTIVTCPMCGALGQAGSFCAFCDTRIPEHKNQKGTKVYTNAVIPKQTITSEEFANKISKYHNVGPWQQNMAKVSIGDLSGVINRNGDLLMPLRYKYLKISYDSLLIFGENSYLHVYDVENNIIYDRIISNYVDSFITYDNLRSIVSTSGVDVSRGLEGQLIFTDNIPSHLKEEFGMTIMSEIYDIKSKQFFDPRCGRIDVLEAYNCYINRDDIYFCDRKRYPYLTDGYKIIFKDGLVKNLTNKRISGLYLKPYNMKDRDIYKKRIEESFLEIKIEIETSENVRYVKPPEDLFDAVNSAVKLIESEKQIINNKPNKGCVVILLPLLAFAVGATIGVIELIKRILL